jgi:putative CocE/NonD family hydrolase
VLTVGGWFDTEDLYGPLKTYQAVESNNPGIENVLVMGPWFHGGWVRTRGEALGAVSWGFETVEYYRNGVELPFFLKHLKEREAVGLPEALAFETGANRWRTFGRWPPAGVESKPLYLREGGRLDFDAPQDPEAVADSYVSDPAKPVPYTMEITTRWARDYMTEDQRFAAWRPDVLVYRTDVLEDDLTVAGPLRAELFVSTTGTDSDWVVKLIDVFPDQLSEARAGEDEERQAGQDGTTGGYQMLVRGEVFRGRFRNSYERPEPFVPGAVAEVAFELQDVLHTFKRGHRVMVQVQSTWFPFVDRNPQKYVPNIFEAVAEDFIRVTNSVHRSRRHPSRLVLGLLH